MASTNYKAANYWLSSENCSIIGINTETPSRGMKYTPLQSSPPDCVLCCRYLMLEILRFATKESAAHAIVATHNTEVAGHTVKCSWGKESGDPNNIHTNAQVDMQVSQRED